MDAEERKKELMAQNKIADGMMFKMDDDPRIIKGIGHFIRDYSIDELPQLINVLKGEMSLVGTRPPTVDEYKNTVSTTRFVWRLSLASQECGRSAAEATSPILSRWSRWTPNTSPSGAWDWISKSCSKPSRSC